MRVHWSVRKQIQRDKERRDYRKGMSMFDEAERLHARWRRTSDPAYKLRWVRALGEAQRLAGPEMERQVRRSFDEAVPIQVPPDFV